MKATRGVCVALAPARFAAAGLWCLLLVAGCQMPAVKSVPEDELRRRALEALRNGLRYEASPLIRAQAIEALSEVAPGEGKMWLRELSSDPYPGVRFAARLALGDLRPKDLGAMMRRALAEEQDPSARAAAIYALHRSGDAGYTSELARLLLETRDAAVKANVALILGKLGDASALPLLRRALREDRLGVDYEIVEAAAALGDTRALQQLVAYTYGGAADRQVLALLALGRSGKPEVLEACRYHLKNGEYLEVRLAAARALGMLGYDDGYDVALDALDFNEPRRDVPNDPPANQIQRIRVMAARALGAIGRKEALPALQRALEDQSDPRIQLAAATAILEILGREDWLGQPAEQPGGGS